MEIIFGIVRWVVIIALLGVVLFRIFRIIRPFETGLVERLGKFHREAKSGLNIVIPGLERIIIVDMSCLLYTSPSPRDCDRSRMPSSA